MLALLVLVPAAPAQAESWREYVDAPRSRVVHPAAVVQATGDVENPEALVGGPGVTTLRYGGEADQKPAVVLDFGREVGGFPVFGVRGHSQRAVLRSAFSETIEALHPFGDYAGKERPRRVQDFVLGPAGGLRSRHLEGGLRYMRITLARPGTASLSGAGIVYSPPRLTSRTLRGRFLSSDELLNRIWHAGVHTISLNQVVPGLRQAPGQLAERPVLVDGAKRDRKIWAGDLLTAGPTVYYTLDPRYIRWSLRLLTGTEIGRPGPFPGFCHPNTRGRTGCAFYSAAYSLAVVVALEEYYRYTGDLEFVWQQWPQVARQMEWAAAKVHDGLFTVTESTGATWNLELFPGRLTAVNATYHDALHAAARLSDALGTHAGPIYRARAEQLRTAVNGQLWNAQRGVYDMSTTQRGFTAQDANVLAILSGIASPLQRESILEHLPRALASPYGALNVERPFPPGFRPVVSPFMGGLQLRAAFAGGHVADALSLLRTEWGYMLDRGPGGTAWERIPVHGELRRKSSAAHSWSTGATAALSQYVLGAEPTRPGWQRWRIKPRPGDVGWARGVVPTPRGRIRIRWDQRGPLFRLEVRAPRSTRGTVHVPLQGAERAVTRDGRPVKLTRRGDYAVLGNQRGRHVYAWRVRR